MQSCQNCSWAWHNDYCCTSTILCVLSYSLYIATILYQIIDYTIMNVIVRYTHTYIHTYIHSGIAIYTHAHSWEMSYEDGGEGKQSSVCCSTVLIALTKDQSVKLYKIIKHNCDTVMLLWIRAMKSPVLKTPNTLGYISICVWVWVTWLIVFGDWMDPIQLVRTYVRMYLPNMDAFTIEGT